ncbi:hypothetical protein G6F68_019049 [Rhizopus microsporus]|nr:hypothetical protein G6F68_019049 [Rhizopus microsporus]
MPATSTKRATSSSILRLPTKMPCKRLLPAINAKGAPGTAANPLTPPITAMVPPMRAAATERASVPSPPTSSTTCAPSPAVRRKASSCHSGVSR